MSCVTTAPRSRLRCSHSLILDSLLFCASSKKRKSGKWLLLPVLSSPSMGPQAWIVKRLQGVGMTPANASSWEPLDARFQGATYNTIVCISVMSLFIRYILDVFRARYTRGFDSQYAAPILPVVALSVVETCAMALSQWPSLPCRRTLTRRGCYCFSAFRDSTFENNIVLLLSHSCHVGSIFIQRLHAILVAPHPPFVSEMSLDSNKIIRHVTTMRVAATILDASSR